MSLNQVDFLAFFCFFHIKKDGDDKSVTIYRHRLSFKLVSLLLGLVLELAPCVDAVRILDVVEVHKPAHRRLETLRNPTERVAALNHISAKRTVRARPCKASAFTFPGYAPPKLVSTSTSASAGANTR